MATVDGGPVVAHAQAFADEINRRWGFTHIMTYPGHEPDQQHALDNFQTRDVMLQLADWCTHDDVIDRYGIDYVIFNVDESTVGGEIYNREISRSWRHMPDRGGITQNHHDHVHVSFMPTAQGPFTPTPTPTATPAPQEGKDVYTYDFGGGIYVTDFIFRQHIEGPGANDLGWYKPRVKGHLGNVNPEFHNDLVDAQGLAADIAAIKAKLGV